jgi:hypothetical protein
MNGVKFGRPTGIMTIRRDEWKGILPEDVRLLAEELAVSSPDPSQIVPLTYILFSRCMNFLESSDEILCSKTSPSGVIPLMFPSFKNI